MKEVDLHICRARGLNDYQACAKLQKEVWGFSDIKDIVPQPILLIGNEYGGSVLIAEEPRSGVVGFSFAMLGRRAGGGLIWWSHMTGVSEARRGRRIGFRLKLAQREDALKNGVSEIWWTFDPLQAMNAHFNLRKLGAVVSKYEENVYGLSSSPLHNGMPTDRFVAKWHLESDRVKDRITGETPVILRNFDRLVPIIEANKERPSPPALELDDNLLSLEIPTNFNNLQKLEPTLARDWQQLVRLACRHYFSQGYVMTDFILADTPKPKALYLLEKQH